MPNRKKWWRLALYGVLGVVAVHQVWRHGHDYVFAEQFAVVVPGKVYRAAWLKTWPLERVVREHHIKTVLALAHPDDSPQVQSEKRMGDELGFRFVHIPIVDDRSDPDRKLLYSRLEEAAAQIADPKNQPVLFHCHHGINRASMAQMAYRMIYCDYTLEQAEAEISDTFGLKEVSKGPDYRHMKGFYAERVLPLRAARAKTSAEDPARR